MSKNTKYALGALGAFLLYRWWSGRTATEASRVPTAPNASEDPKVQLAQSLATLGKSLFANL